MNHPLSADSAVSGATTSPGGTADAPRGRTGGNATSLEVIAVFLVGMLIMNSVYVGPGAGETGDRGVPGNDSFYHIKMATLIPEHGLLSELPWLRFTYFTNEGHDFVEHHYGFHILLLPFVYVSKWLTDDYLVGGRWAMTVLFGLSLVLFDLLLVTAQARWRWLWLIMYVLMPSQFFTRHAYVRAISPSLSFMLLITLTMFRRKHVLTGLAITCYIQLYLGGVLYAPVLVAMFAASSLIGPASDRDVPWRLLAWSLAGWLAGLLVHPYAHGIWDFLQLQVFGSGLSPDIPVGREWEPYEGLWWFAQMSGPVLLIWAAALFLRFRLGTPLNAQESMLLLSHLFFLGLTFKARRFIEYWPAFSLLSSAYLLAPLMGKLADHCDQVIHLPKLTPVRWLYRALPPLVAGVALALVRLLPQWNEIRRVSQCEYDLPAVSSAMQYLTEHSQPGDVVFTDDWDIFPVFFYYNSHNHYIVGLDPKFTHARDPALWKRYVKITRGEVPAGVSVKLPNAVTEGASENIHVTLDDIRQYFGARFVVTDQDHTKLALKLANRADLAEVVYPSSSYDTSRKAPYVIFRIRDAAGTGD